MAAAFGALAIFARFAYAGGADVLWQITQKFQLLVRAGHLPGVDAVYRWAFK